MAGAVVGIDLGTTNTVVAVVRGGKALVLADETGARLLPSVVSFHPNGEVLVGAKARERRLVDARNTVYSIKRLIGRSWNSDEVERARQRFPFELREGPTHGPLVAARNETYTLPEISAFVLRRAKAIAENALGEAVERAVVTVPASFNDLQRASTKVAAREAGLEVLRILNEPTAAALAYGFGKAGNERIAVYDFGGGTFDLTLLDLSGNVFEVIATAGDSFLGGDDVDNVIADRIAQVAIQQTRFDPRGDVQAMERLRAAAEQVKITLSTQQEMSVELKEIGYGPGGRPIDLKFTLGRTELEQLSNQLVERTFNVCAEALQLARLKHDAFDNIILVGGSTRIPLVRRKVEQFFAKKPMDRVNPDEVVAIGAAIQAAALTGAERRRQSTPAPILNTDAVKPSRIQTLGGLQKTGSKGPLAPPPPPRTTGRLVGPPLEQVTRDGTREDSVSDEVTVNRAMLPLGAPPNAPATRPPIPARPVVTSPMVPQSRPLDRNTGRLIGTPIPTPAIDLSDDPPTAPGNSFPDHSPEPIALQHLVPLSPAMSLPQHGPMPPPPAITPPPLPSPFGMPAGQPSGQLKTQLGMQPVRMPLPEIAPQQALAAPPMPTPGPSLKSTQIVTSQATPPMPMPNSGASLKSTQITTGPGTIPPLPALPGLPSTSPNSSPMVGIPTPFGAGAPPAWPQQTAPLDVPLLIDVTPLTLSVEVVGGYVDRVIARNSPVPCSQTRQFTTSADGQVVVVLRVCQGEGDLFQQNTALGTLELSGLRKARRGDINVEVTFELDADGILNVHARDMETGRQTGAQMRLIGMDQAGARPPMRS